VYLVLSLNYFQDNVQVSSDASSGTARREVIETSLFSKQMWCSNCNIPLSLDFAIEKEQRGLSNQYTVKCCRCPFLKRVHTNSVFGDKNQYATINAKAAMGNSFI